MEFLQKIIGQPKKNVSLEEGQWLRNGQGLGLQRENFLLEWDGTPDDRTEKGTLFC